jgi:hypothetical protein
MYSDPVQFSLFEDPRKTGSEDDTKEKPAQEETYQLSFDFMIGSVREQEPRDLRTMRM